MDHVVNYFTHIPSIHRALILAGGISLFWLIETAIPLFKFDYNKWRHASLNIFFTITTIIVNFGFALVIVFASDWCNKNGFGLLRLWRLPLWIEMIAGLMLLDLIGAYLIHFIQHKIKWMWRFHMVHHADTFVDTTTANRHHPGESVFRATFAVIAVFITGAPIWLVMLYQSLSVVLSQFNHANIKIPLWVDKVLRIVIVTPGMHRVHHHFTRPETDSNYGNIFSFWDRIFGTYIFKESDKLHYGLDILRDRKVSNLKDQIKLPFEKNLKADIQ